MAGATKRALAILALAALLVSCAPDAPADPMHVVVATIDSRSLSLADFQAYLDTNRLRLSPPREAGSDPEAAAIESRLFDDFVREALLAREADARGLKVKDAEVLAELARSGPGPRSVARRRAAAQRLRLGRLEATLVADLPPVTEEQIEAELAARGARTAARRSVRFRTLRFDDEEAAAKVRKRLRRGRETFDELLVAMDLPPDQGLVAELDWAALQPELQAAIEPLRAGQVSEPVALHGGYFLFQVQSKRGRRPWAVGEREAARRRLEAARRRGALATLEKELREQRDVTVHLDRLPFVYVEEPPNES